LNLAAEAKHALRVHFSSITSPKQCKSNVKVDIVKVLGRV